MEAVHRRTSNDVQALHIPSPSGHTPADSSMRRANGMTSIATRRSDTARETMRRFDGVCSFLTRATARQTRALPTTVPTMIVMHAAVMATVCHGNDDSSLSPWRPKLPKPVSSVEDEEELNPDGES